MATLDAYSSAGEWLNSDFSYEYCNDSSHFNQKCNDSFSTWSAFGENLYNDPVSTIASTFAPGLMSAWNSSDLSRSERFQSYGRAGFDLLALGLTSKAVISAGRSRLATNSMRIEATIESKLAINGTRGIGYSAESFVGKKGWELKNPRYQQTRNFETIINNRMYSAHALDQMQNRGFMPLVIENTINKGIKLTGKAPGTFGYYETVNDITVITNAKNGRVITTSFGRID